MGGFRRVTVQILAHSADYTVRNGNIEAAWIILFHFLARYIWLSAIGLLIWMSSFWSAVQFLSVHIHEFASFGSGDLFWPFPSVWLARTPYIVAVCGLLEEQIVGRRGWASWKYMVRWLPLAVIFDYAVSVPFLLVFSKPFILAYVFFSHFAFVISRTVKCSVLVVHN